VTTPPRLTQAEYVAFLDTLPVHPSGLSFASSEGKVEKVEKVKRILMNNPNFDVNWKSETEEVRTALYVACERGYDAIVSILLVHPDINVNLKARSSVIPFLRACLNGNTSCVRLLLKDSRVKVNEPTSNGYTPLWHAARHGRFDLIKWWIASGREVDLGKPGDVEKTDALGRRRREARQKWRPCWEDSRRIRRRPGIK